MDIRGLNILKGLALLARDLRARGLTEREIQVTDQWREILGANQTHPLELVAFARPPLIQEWLTEEPRMPYSKWLVAKQSPQQGGST